MLTKISNKENLTAGDFVGDSFVFYDLKLQKRNKQYILDLTQYWKNFIKSNNVSSLLLVDYLTPDSLAIFLACLETGVELLTSPNDKQKTLYLSDQVDKVLIGELMVDRLYVDVPKYIKYTYAEQVDTVYTPELINWNSILISGYTSGTTGTPKKITHSPMSFLSASVLSSQFFNPEDQYATYPNFNHLGVVSMHVMGPIIAGVTLYAITGNLDMISLLSRKMLSKITFFESHLKELQTHFSAAYTNLSGVELYCGGGSPSQMFVDWFFSKNGKKIYTFFGASECLPPVFYNEILNTEYLITDRNLGKTVPPYVINKDSNDQLGLKGPAVGINVKLDKQGFYNTGDYVTIDNNSVKYLGRKRIETDTGFLYQVEVENFINFQIAKEGLLPSSYFVDFDVGTIKLMPNSATAHQALTRLKEALDNRFSGLQVIITPTSADESGFKVTQKRAIN